MYADFSTNDPGVAQPTDIIFFPMIVDSDIRRESLYGNAASYRPVDSGIKDLYGDVATFRPNVV